MKQAIKRKKKDLPLNLAALPEFVDRLPLCYSKERRCVPPLIYLFWNGGIVPVLAQIDHRNQAVVDRCISHKDNIESEYSIDHRAGTEHTKDHLLKSSPVTQKSCALLIIFHRLAVPTAHASLSPR